MRTRGVGWFLLAPAWIVALGLAALVATRALEDDSNKYLAMLHAQTVWVYLPAYGICVAAVLFRHKTLAIVAAIAVCAHVFLVFESAGPAAHVPAVFDAPLRVVSSNVRYNNPEPEALARELLSYNADVLLLQEVTPAWLKTLHSVFGDNYPHVVSHPRTDSGGLAIFSRYPFLEVREVEAEHWPTISVRVDFERDFSLVDVHAIGPQQGMDRHVATMDAIEHFARTRVRPRVVAGDFNATPYNASMEQMYDLGLDDAHERAGRGLATTWPNGEKPLPPIRLDHVLVDEGVIVRSIREGKGRGSDHRPVIVDIAFPDPDYPND